MTILAPFISLALRLGVAQRLSRLAGGVLAFLSVLLLLGALYGGWRLWLADHVDDAIEADRAASNAEASNVSTKASEKAWWQAAKDQADIAERAEQLRKDAANETDSGLAGNRTRAVIERVRSGQTNNGS